MGGGDAGGGGGGEGSSSSESKKTLAMTKDKVDQWSPREFFKTSPLCLRVLFIPI